MNRRAERERAGVLTEGRELVLIREPQAEGMADAPDRPRGWSRAREEDKGEGREGGRRQRTGQV